MNLSFHDFISTSAASAQTVKINESDPFLKSSLFYKAPQDEELMDFRSRLGLALLLLPLLDLLTVNLIMMKNLVDLLDHVHFCAFII